MKKDNQVRLAKFLAEAGVASRRKSEELIKTGKVKIGAKTTTDVSTSVPEDADNIFVSGKKVFLEKKVYYLLNKPQGYICSLNDPHNDKTVLELVPKSPKVFPVGRLDKDSEGLLIMTNDGELAYRLTHPKFEVQKTYLVKVDKFLDKTVPEKLKKGVRLDQKTAKADRADIVSSRQIQVVIHQGIKRQLRRMLEKLGYQVIVLKRIQEGKLKLGDLPAGKYKSLNPKDI